MIWDYHLGSSGLSCDHLGSSWIIWDHLGSSGPICAHLGSAGIIWVHPGSSGIIWAQLRSSGIILDHVGSSRIIWAHLRSSGLGWDLWVHLGSSGIIWDHLWSQGQKVFKSMLLNIILYACAYKMARGRRRVGIEWQSRIHEVLRLCIHNSPAHGKCTIDKNTPSARSNAPVHTK